MFLTENYTMASSEASYDPVYAMQIMQEATEDWNDICMKMIKLEHTAIMREDAELLAEGFAEAVSRFKTNVITVGKKFLEFLERVRVQWSKIQASVATKFLNTEAIKSVLNSYNEKAKTNFPKDWDECLQTVDKMSSAINACAEALEQACRLMGRADGEKNAVESDDIDDKILAILERTSFKNYEETKDREITKQDIEKALSFLKKRPVAIKNIELMKKCCTKLQNALIKDMDDKTAKANSRNYLVTMQSAFNKIIIKINKMTTVAIRICSAAKPNKTYNGVGTADYNRAKENNRKANGVYYEVNGKVKKESVLDLFN